MYMISFFCRTSRNIETLAGDKDAIFSIANLFEENKVFFKVASSNSHLEPEAFGAGGFSFWLKPGQVFPSSSSLKESRQGYLFTADEPNLVQPLHDPSKSHV